MPIPGKSVGASVREPGDGVGARRPGMALAPGLHAILWLHHGRAKNFLLIAHAFHISTIFRPTVSPK
jgi:hypothetical protein